MAAKAVVVSQAGASLAEQHAARELRDHLQKITGTDIALRSDATQARAGAIVVGQGPIAKRLFPEVRWEALGQEQTLIRSKGGVLLVAGGRPRGTLYAVYRLLSQKCGVRWWTPWATTVPKNPKLAFPPMNWSETPAFEYRDAYWFHAFDADWAARNFSNGFNARLDPARGGRVEYQGFVHTYYGLVPPDPLFGQHPEWFSLIDGKRTADNAQLCTTNPALREYVLEQVRKQLRANPKATIASVSQNDCFRPCQCENCRALATREGSDSALVLDLANFVGERIEKEFPGVAIDTLAYQWSRKPPLHMKPRPNVVVRLCSIECNFAFSLDAPENASFGDDLRGWSKLSKRLYVWDYCTDFAHYLQPHPDTFTLGPTIRFFAENGVKGVFEEGAYQSNGGEMAELKAWLIAQLLWDPKQDPDKLIDEFLRGYYGAAAPSVRRYLELMAKEAQGWNLSFASPTTASFLRYDVVSKARAFLVGLSTMWGDSSSTNPAHWRIRQLVASLDYVVLARWSEFRREAMKRGDRWDLPATRGEFAGKWTKTVGDANGAPEGWSPVTHVNESGLSPQGFIDRLGPEPPPPVLRVLPPRKVKVLPPAGLQEGIDLQDDLANLWREPDGAELRPDPLASDGIACWMPGSHHEWAFQIPLSQAGEQAAQATGKVFVVYVVVRLDTEGRDGSAGFSAGVYSNAARKDLVTWVVPIDETASGYQTYQLGGALELAPSLTVWVAPPSNPKVKAVWVDRVYLVRATGRA